MILEQLNFPITSLKGIGKKTAGILEADYVTSVGALLEYYPRAFSDRRKLQSLQQAAREGFGTVKVKVIEHRMVGKSKWKQFLKILIHDGNSFGALLCFNRNFLQDKLKEGLEFYITGKFAVAYNEIQASSFEYEEAVHEYKGRILPVYPLKTGLTQNILRHSIEDALSKYFREIEDELPRGLIEKNGLLRKREAVKQIHFPPDFSAYNRARRTLIYEDFFFQKLFLLKRKETVKKIAKTRKTIPFKLKKALIKSLPFRLTGYQKKAVEALESHLFSASVFSVLLQGDVGSGKTLVALLAMLCVVETGSQCALMVPTEVLAGQHYNNIKKMTRELGLDVALLTGSLKKRERDNILSGLKSGEIKIIIGTHALFSPDVIYMDLGLAVIDEQHRFGVDQRYNLLSKGDAVDLLLMTATPIPQSLALTLYGDMDLVVMKGTIAGRKPVKTWVINDEKERLAGMYDWIKETIDKEDGRALFVYSLIEDSEKLDRKDLNAEYASLKKIFSSYGTGFVHSKVSPEDKETLIDDFRSGKIKILAATTVVEVGLDIPDANIIVIENAETYGLSTLHQLRGRVGRSGKQGYMILVTELSELTESGQKRLEIIKHQKDGFIIAEEDLKLRGPGDFIGKRQSGLPNIKLADLSRDMETLKAASSDACLLIEEDCELEKPDHFNTRKSFLHRLKSYIPEDE